jgi:hypothetical protein
VTELNEVFGLNRYRNPQSYVIRAIEDNFVAAIGDPGVVLIVVAGLSKQGKTSLMRHALREGEFVHTQGNRGVDTKSLFTAILNKCEITQEAERAQGLKGEVGGGFRWFKISIGATGETVREYVQIDLGNADSVANVLSKSDRRRLIVVDNFHYLSPEVQAELATAIRSFETYGFKFVIIGTWSGTGYLQKYNSDLSATTREFSFDSWSYNDLRAVLRKGCPLLNTSLSESVEQSLIHKSIESVSLLQELTNLYLKGRGVTCRQDHHVRLEDVEYVKVVGQQLEDRIYQNTLETLRRISAIGGGNPYLDGRSRSWWIMYAFLGGTGGYITKGTPVDKLYAATINLVRERAKEVKKKVEDIDKQEFMGLLRQHWHHDQTKNGATAVLTYHEIDKTLVVVDAYVRFVLRTNEKRNQIRNDLMVV